MGSGTVSTEISDGGWTANKPVGSQEEHPKLNKNG